MAKVSPQRLSIATAISNRNREAGAALTDLRRVRDSGSYYEDGVLLAGDLMRAAGDLVASSLVPSFDQGEFRTLPLERVRHWDLERDVAAPLREMGGGVFLQFDLMLLRLLVGSLESSRMEWADYACRFLLGTDGRMEWKERQWDQRVWKLTADLLSACYWMDAPELAREVLEKRWMPSGKSAVEWADVPDVWTRKRMDWLDFAFWRSWWVSELGLRAQEHLDRERVLSHAIFLFDAASQINATLADYVAMAHAQFYPRRWPTEIRELVNRLLRIEPRPWR